MRLLAIDPGANLGYAIFEDREPVDFGQCKTKPQDSQVVRLREIRHFIEGLFDEHQPDVMVIENIMPLATSLKSRDAIYWLTATYHIACIEADKRGVTFTAIIPSAVKKAVTGKGNAKKHDMVAAINKHYDLNLKKNQHNAADALGVGFSFFVDTSPKLMFN